MVIIQRLDYDFFPENIRNKVVVATNAAWATRAGADVGAAGTASAKVAGMGADALATEAGAAATAAGAVGGGEAEAAGTVVWE